MNSEQNDSVLPNLNETLLVALDHNNPDHPVMVVGRRYGDVTEIINMFQDDSAALLYWALTGAKKVQIKLDEVADENEKISKDILHQMD